MALASNGNRSIASLGMMPFVAIGLLLACTKKVRVEAGGRQHWVAEDESALIRRLDAEADSMSSVERCKHWQELAQRVRADSLAGESSFPDLEHPPSEQLVELTSNMSRGRCREAIKVKTRAQGAVVATPQIRRPHAATT